MEKDPKKFWDSIPEEERQECLADTFGCFGFPAGAVKMSSKQLEESGDWTNVERAVVEKI